MKKAILIIAITATLALPYSARASGPPSLRGCDCWLWKNYPQLLSDALKVEAETDSRFTESYEGEFKEQGERRKVSYLEGLIDSANYLADYSAKNGEKDTADRIRLSHFFFDYLKPVDTLCSAEANAETKIAELIYDAEILLNEEQKKEK